VKVPAGGGLYGGVGWPRNSRNRILDLLEKADEWKARGGSLGRLLWEEADDSPIGLAHVYDEPKTEEAASPVPVIETLA
jgi:hypothetical protein